MKFPAKFTAPFSTISKLLAKTLFVKFTVFPVFPASIVSKVDFPAVSPPKTPVIVESPSNFSVALEALSKVVFVVFKFTPSFKVKTPAWSLKSTFPFNSSFKTTSPFPLYFKSFT